MDGEGESSLGTEDAVHGAAIPTTAKVHAKWADPPLRLSQRVLGLTPCPTRQRVARSIEPKVDMRLPARIAMEWRGGGRRVRSGHGLSWHAH
jgi:hypothetical protein